MISSFIVSLFVVSFTASIYLYMPLLAESILELFSFYVFTCFIDAIFGIISLKRTAARRGAKTSAFHPLTWVGRQFGNYQEAISYRLNSLSDQVEEASSNNELQTPEPTAENQEEFFEQILEELELSFRPTSCAIIAQDNQLKFPRVFIKGIRGKRLKETLLDIFANWFSSLDTSKLGVQDTLKHDFSSEELSAFGIHFLVSSAFQSKERQGILILGFGPNKAPSSKVLRSLDEFAKKLEREFETFVSFQDLKARVDLAEKTTQARTEFLTHVSHDIKSPLNNVKTILSLLREDLVDSSDGKQLVEAAIRNCNSVAELVDSLIDFAKHRAGKLMAAKSEVDLNELLDEVVQSYEPTAKAKGLHLSFNVPVGLAACSADKGQIRRVFMNLVSNAVKYTKFGNVAVSVSLHDQHTWAVKISDTGPGFNAEQLNQLFTPFSRFDNRGIEGVGLGLALSKILLDLNGGSFKVTSEPFVATEFTVFIPCSTDFPNFAEQPTDLLKQSNGLIDVKSLDQIETSNELSGRLKDLSLLVVDDDYDTTQALARILAKENAEVAQAITVPDAISIMNFDEPDVLITDANMPEGGGKRLIKYARLNLPNMAIIVITGDLSKSEELIALGASCVMDKPVHLSELLDYLEDMTKSVQRKEAVGI